MPSIRDIKTRLKAVDNIKKITRAMELVAAAKFKRSETRAKTARPYREALDGILRILAGLAADDATKGSKDSTVEISLEGGEPPIEVELARIFEQPGGPEPKRIGLVLVTSDRGLCGAFNTRLIRAALEFVGSHPDKDVRLIPIGRKGYQFLRNRQITILHREERVSDRLDLDEIKRIAGKLVRLFVTGEVDAVYIAYAEFRSAMTSTVKIDRFLSIPRVESDKAQENYILEPDRRTAFGTLLPLYATTKVFATLADSFASEYGARMTAMQLATKNAEEMLQNLVIERNRLRQAAITKELSEIVGGAEALR